ncbi:MAG: glutamate synthase subunit beta [Actinobacteria bacterium]|nr:glutamate synthase subunit beta [Actinomycetota bacterium]NCV83679.1 glutamate synthase subunit beta [Actinomycetota bacterium]
MSVFRIAIVGAGPAGYFAAQALQNLQTPELKFEIDMIERLPTPWGLVRSGVAPDHPKIKTVSKVFEKIATTEGFQLFCNVELGKDLTLTELTNLYDAVVIATGTSRGRKLGIPGEELRGSLSAAEFVPWYNAHPDYVDVDVPLDTDTAVVIGAGNVAMDVARMLALEPKELDVTDTANHALAELHKSAIRQVHVFGRRGPEHVAFTSPELRELPKLEHTDVEIGECDIEDALERVSTQGELPKDVKSNLDAMMLVARTPKKGNERKLNFHFLASPIEIKGKDRVEEVVFAINEVKDGKVVTTSDTYSVKTGLIISAIGYEADPIPGLTYVDGKVSNVDGHVENSNIYVVGWAKRGPSGVIGTNKSDAAGVMELLVSNLREPKPKVELSEKLQERGVIHVSQGAWEKINASEVAAGEPLGKPRVKFVKREEMLGLQ